MGNKTGPIDYIEHPVPLLGGEISEQESYVSKGGPLGGYLGLGNLSNLVAGVT